MSSGDGALGAGFPFLPDEHRSRYLSFNRRSWNYKSVDGRIITATRWIRGGTRNSDQQPIECRKIGCASPRTVDDQGLLLHERGVSDNSPCASGPMNLAVMVNRWARSTSRSFMAGQGRAGCFQERVCPGYRFQLIIINSPGAGYLKFGPGTAR